MSQLKYGQIINCGLTTLIVSLFSLCRLQITTQLRSGAIDKIAGIFTKRIWQLYMCQPNELKREIKKKTVGAKRGPSKNLGGHGPPRPPLESPLLRSRLGLEGFRSPSRALGLETLYTLFCMKFCKEFL